MQTQSHDSVLQAAILQELFISPGKVPFSASSWNIKYLFKQRTAYF